MKNVLIYTVHKAASSFLNILLRQTARRFAIQHFSENDENYYDHIHELSWPVFIESRKHQNACIGPIRGNAGQAMFPKRLDDYSVVLHVRDPRDVLTSMYFSHAYSHTIREGRFQPSDNQRQKWQREGIDCFVLHTAKGLRRTYELLCNGLLGHDKVIVVRYEEMVTDFGSWLDRYLAAFDHLDCPPHKNRHRLLPQSFRRRKIRNQLYNRHKNAFQVDHEDKRNHKRKVTPGDYLEKLEPSTTELLNSEFQSLLDRLGYQSNHRVNAA